VVPKVLTYITAVYNVYCMHDTIATVSLLENGPLVAASYLSGSRGIHIERSRIRAHAYGTQTIKWVGHDCPW